MSGGFFRGTSADQDTRFSNKTAKLLKTQKFAPELDQLIDMTKVHLDSLRPWIATRVTQLLGFEDEVLINYIYGLLEEKKNVDGKQIQIHITGFMEKNTGKFMKELWGLLTSAQSSTTGIPQQFLEEKAEEARLKKAEEHRVISEVRRKEDERRALEQEALKKEREGGGVDLTNSVNPTASKQRSRSPSRGGKSPDGDRIKRNGTLDSRPSRSRSRSVSNTSKSVSKSPPPASKRRISQSLSHSPSRRSRRSRSPPRRGRSPNYKQRSRSPSRRLGWSPGNTRSPRRRRRSYSRSPRRRSPLRRRRSPHHSRSPHGRSPIVRSPRRRHSPAFTRLSPRRRASPSRSPRYRRRSPRPAHSPVRRHHHASSPGRRRYTPPRHSDLSPRRRPHVASPRPASPSPRPRTRSLSAEAVSKSPPQNRYLSNSPHRLSSASSPRQLKRPSSPPRGKSSIVLSSHQKSSPAKGRPSRGPASPVKQPKLSYQHHSSVSLSPKPSRKGAESPDRIVHTAHVQSRALSPSLSPPKRRRSGSLSEASPTSEKSQSRSPSTARGSTGERPATVEQRDPEILPMNRKRTRSSSRERSLPAEDRQLAPTKMPGISDASAGVPSIKIQQTERLDESLSRSSNDDQQASPSGKFRNTQDIESDGNGEGGHSSPVSFDDKKTAKRRRKEDRRLRKEEKRRKREERHKRKEERRANKALSKGIASVTPPPDFDKRTVRTDDFDSADEGKVHYDEETEIEQRKLENELRRKALDSIRAKKVVSS